MNEQVFTVTVNVPAGVSTDDMETYIQEAIGGWKGGFDPENPLFKLDRESIRVDTGASFLNLFRRALRAWS